MCYFPLNSSIACSFHFHFPYCFDHPFPSRYYLNHHYHMDYTLFESKSPILHHLRRSCWFACLPIPSQILDCIADFKSNSKEHLVDVIRNKNHL